MTPQKDKLLRMWGPYKTSLSSTDLPVYFDPNGYKFRTSESLEKAKKTMVIAPQNFYVNLKNPTDDNLHPTIGNTSISPKLEIGKKVVIQGPPPCSFALFPGQMAQVIKGHQLRSNQYLIVRIYDEKSARENWSKAVVKSVEGKDANSNTLETISADTISLGNDYVIKGTEVSFYMPPTGVEVLKNSEGAYVRDAVTLERLEYCILLDEEGEKRYEKGP
jgi:major vault protein